MNVIKQTTKHRVLLSSAELNELILAGLRSKNFEGPPDISKMQVRDGKTGELIDSGIELSWLVISDLPKLPPRSV